MTNKEKMIADAKKLIRSGIDNDELLDKKLKEIYEKYPIDSDNSKTNKDNEPSKKDSNE